MARIAKKSKAKRVKSHTTKITKRTHAKNAKADDVNKALKHAKAQSLATSMDHMPFDLGYSFK
jgi:hypothetical protein